MSGMAHIDDLNRKSGRTYVYKVCMVASPASCSNDSKVVFWRHAPAPTRDQTTARLSLVFVGV